MKERDKLIEQLSEANPLEIGKRLQEIELYEKEDTMKVIDEVYEEFSSGAHMEESVLKPVFCSIIDGLLEAFRIGRKMRKKGLTASRIYQDCKDFSYDGEQHHEVEPDAYQEYKNARECSDDYNLTFGNNETPTYERIKYDDGSKNKYKERAVNANEGRVNLKDEYTGKTNIYANQNNPDRRRNDPTHRFQAQPDHIIPLSRLQERLKKSYALKEEDIVEIANNDYNLALTGAYINQGIQGQGGKNDMTNSEFVADQRLRKKEGRPHLGLDEETLENMLNKEKESQKVINQEVRRRQRENCTQLFGKVSKNGAKQAGDYAFGNLLMFLIKPIYYEIADCIKTGIEEGVGADSARSAFKIRFGRVKAYVLSHVHEFVSGNIGDFIKNLISSIIEGIISLFVGIFKRVLKVVKEGICIFVNSAKVLFGKDSKKMSAAEKGDAIIKIIGGGIIALCGIGLEDLINKIGIPEPWSVVLSTMLSGIASALFMYLLDRIDLFSLKAEKRRNRIIEIFDERINDIQKAVDYCKYETLETLRKQQLEFNDIYSNIQCGIKNDNLDVIDKGLDRMADFFGVKFPYRTNDEFWDYMDSDDKIEL